MIAEDEFAGAVGTGQCPNGGVHVFETTGAMETSSAEGRLLELDTLGPTDQVDGTCTAHVFDIHEDEKVMTIAYYNGGVHVVDLAGLDRDLARRPAARRRGHEGDRPLPDPEHGRVVGQDAGDRPGRLVPPVRQRHRPGPRRSEFDGVAAESARYRTWMGAPQAAKYFAVLPTVTVTKGNALVCLLPQ